MNCQRSGLYVGNSSFILHHLQRMYFNKIYHVSTKRCSGDCGYGNKTQKSLLLSWSSCSRDVDQGSGMVVTGWVVERSPF